MFFLSQRQPTLEFLFFRHPLNGRRFFTARPPYHSLPAFFSFPCLTRLSCFEFELRISLPFFTLHRIRGAVIGAGFLFFSIPPAFFSLSRYCAACPRPASIFFLQSSLPASKRLFNPVRFLFVRRCPLEVKGVSRSRASTAPFLAAVASCFARVLFTLKV